MSLSRLLSSSLLSLVLAAPLAADDWPQWLGPRRDGVWRETGLIETFPAGGPRVLWRTPIGAGYSGPAVVGDRVYITDRKLDRGARNPDNPFRRGSIPGSERVLCLNAADGAEIWKHEYPCAYTVSYPSGPRATPTVDRGRVYTLGAEGHLFCLDAGTGEVIWEKQLTRAYDIETPVWGFAAHPVIDGDRLICLAGGDGTTVVALDVKTGNERWRALSSREPGYCPPVIHEAGGVRQLFVWHPEALESLDPATGKVYWSQPFEVRSGLTIPTPRVLGDALFVTSFYNGPMMLRLDEKKPAATLRWKGDSQSEKKTDKLHAIMCTPFLEDGHIYGVCSYGQLRCLKIETGERVWETLAPTGADPENWRRNRWANAFLVKIGDEGDRYVLASELGELILAELTPDGYTEIDRAKLLEPTNFAMGRRVVWSHPAFASRRVFMRNDEEIICVSMAPAAGEPASR